MERRRPAEKFAGIPKGAIEMEVQKALTYMEGRRIYGYGEKRTTYFSTQNEIVGFNVYVKAIRLTHKFSGILAVNCRRELYGAC